MSAIDHHPTCRRPAPIMRRSWAGEPELFCPDCGRSAPADTAKPEPRTP